MQYKVYQICSIYACRMTTSKISTYDGTEQLLSASAEMVLEWFYKSKLQDSVQHQTVLHLYDQETVRDTWQPSYSRLKTAIRLHIDQAMRTRNFRLLERDREDQDFDIISLRNETRRDARSSTIPNPSQERVQGPLFSHWRKLFS